MDHLLKHLSKDMTNDIEFDIATRYYKFNFSKIHSALIRVGASLREANLLITMLHETGWDGREIPQRLFTFKDFTVSELRFILNWYRAQRGNSSAQDVPDHVQRHIENMKEVERKKLFGQSRRAGKTVVVKKLKDLL